MDFNDLIFPAPKPSYKSTLEGLYYVSKYKHSHKTIISKQLQKENKLVTVQVEQNKEYGKIINGEIVTLYQWREYAENGIIIFFHGNAEDIGMSKSFSFLLSFELQMASICMEYPGYGLYQGKCSSDQMIKDAYILMDHIINELNIKEQKIIIIGRSIGSGIACEISHKYTNIRALVLLSAFTSLCDVIKGLSFNFVGNIVKERFRNLDKIKNITCPTLIIHGKDDKLISTDHSIKLMNACAGIVDLKLFEGMTHNSFIMQIHIIEPIRQFLSKLI